MEKGNRILRLSMSARSAARVDPWRGKGRTFGAAPQRREESVRPIAGNAFLSGLGALHDKRVPHPRQPVEQRDVIPPARNRTTVNVVIAPSINSHEEACPWQRGFPSD